MKKIIVIFSLVISVYNLYSQIDAFSGDLRVSSPNNIPINVTFQIVSIPFEGIATSWKTFHPNNRIDQMFNGSKHRIYDDNLVPNDYPVGYKYKSGNTESVLMLGHCSAGELPDEGITDGAWGFGKYKFTIYVPSTNETYIFYLNCLDSRFGKRPWNGRLLYGDDFTVEYSTSRPLNSRVILWGYDNNQHEVIYATLNTFTQPELKVWELLYGQQEPFAKNFEARTTPFPIHPQLLEDNYDAFKELILGTTVTLGDVYNNAGGHDKYGYNTVTNYLNYYTGTTNYYTGPPIINPAVNNSPGNTFCTPSNGNRFNQGELGMTIKAVAGDKMIIKENKRLWITGGQDLYPPHILFGDIVIFESGSTLEKEPTAQINTCRNGKLIDNGANTIWGTGSFHKAYTTSTIEYNGIQHTVNNAGHIEIDGNATLKLADNTSLIFDGAGTYLKLNPGANVKLGNGASIEFRNGAYLDADGSTFSALNSGNVWNGIKLNKSGADIIKNCTFSNASQYIDVINDNNSSASIKTITGNWFNDGKVTLGNTRYALIQNNTFNGSASYAGNHLEINNTIVFTPSSNPIIINTNTFKSGALQLKIYNSQITPVYIYGNHFYGLSGTSRLGLWAYKVAGEFKMNTFEDNHYNSCALLKNSNINFLSNTLISSDNDNIELTLGSIGVLEPSITDGRPPMLVWNAGKNSLHQNNTNTSLTASNVYFDNGSLVFTDKGQNCYNIYNVSTNNHIIGHYDCLDGHSSTLSATGNYWNIVPPVFSLDCGTTLNYGNPYGNCAAAAPGGSNYTVVDMGSGIYDTLFSESYSDGGDGDGGGKPGAGSLSGINDDKELYGSMLINNRLKNYSAAIDDAKNIINNYSTSKYLVPALDGLYLGYHLSDTTNESNTNILFTSLKSYLEEKMVQYDTIFAFSDKAYGKYLMCLVKLKQYSAAISGYENIMNNHPDPVARLAACWDRASVVLLMSGQGGSYPGIMPGNSKKSNDKKPDRIAKNVFKNATKKADLNSDSKKEKYSKEEKAVISQRVTKFNPTTHKEFTERVSSDINMLLGLNKTAKTENNKIIPVKYMLHQNYPNPFNPITNIRYDIPSNSNITIKIYDLLGKEIFSVKEFKTPGTYEIKFDGSNYASGTYFYSFEANGYKETKKMVLIK